MGIKIHINKKEVDLKDLTNLVFDIYKIASDNCPYCEKHNIKSDKEKLNLIKKLIEKVIY